MYKEYGVQMKLAKLKFRFHNIQNSVGVENENGKVKK